MMPNPKLRYPGKICQEKFTAKLIEERGGPNHIREPA